jgi:hypothetical protein
MLTTRRRAQQLLKRDTHTNGASGYPNDRSLARQSTLLGVLIVAVVLVAAPTASARATTGKFHFEESFEDTITNFPCSEGIPVVMSGTVTGDGHFTESERHFSVHGKETSDYRVDLPDGSFALGHLVDRFRFIFNLNRPRSIETGTQTERATLYSANGRPIGTITVHVTIHFTYADRNGNFAPDPGEITVELERSKVTCS